MPVLNTPAVFTLFAASFALAVYLRAVSSDSQKAVEALMQESANRVWPLSEAFTQERIRLLRRTRQIIEGVTPWVCL